MADGHILVIAPDFDLRRSLEFALEAEGYLVSSRPDIMLDGPDDAYDCTILDDRAVKGPVDDVIRFCRRLRPVVMLVDRPIPWITEWVAAVIEKPMLGKAVASAVGFAILSNLGTGDP